MKEAHRVYMKHKYHLPHESPQFKSSVSRKAHIPASSDPGPGAYQVTLPLIRPKYEAIFKNNRSIIIKVNDVPAPPFFSKQARFKNLSTIQSKVTQDELALRQFQQEVHSKIKNSKRYNFSLARKKSVQNESTNTILSYKMAYEGEPTRQKGIEWSKYREQRQLWKDKKDEPGPGSYTNQKQNPLITPNKKSWQFRSETKRSVSIDRDHEREKELRSQLKQAQHQPKVKSIHSRQRLVDVQY